MYASGIRHGVGGVLAVAAIGVCGLLSGCGGVEDPFERVPVKGTVKVDGQPLQYGQIYLKGELDEETQQAAQMILAVRDGAFDSGSGAGTTAGPNEVTITVYNGDPSSEDSDVDVKATGTWKSQVTVEADQPLAIEIPKEELEAAG